MTTAGNVDMKGKVGQLKERESLSEKSQNGSQNTYMEHPIMNK